MVRVRRIRLRWPGKHRHSEPPSRAGIHRGSGVARRRIAGAGAADQHFGPRAPGEAAGAMHACSRLARREEARHAAHGAVQINLDTAQTGVCGWQQRDHALRQVFSMTGLQNFAPGVAQAEGLRRALAGGEGRTRVAAVTRGERSTLWMTREARAVRETPAFRVEATNTTGAGDVFHGAYALAIAEGQKLAAAMRFASAAGALRARDGRTPTRAMVEAMLAAA